MKWLFLGILVLTVWYGNCRVLKCSPGSDACTTGESPKEEITSIAEVRRKDTMAECLAGSEWESNCHRCLCSESGLAECKRIDSCTTEKYGEPLRCKPQTTFQRECNSCTCLENGFVLCNFDRCETESAVPKKASLKQGKDCEPGTFWKSQCNDCGCSPAGVNYCTDKACPGQESEHVMQCSPNTVWLYDCNTCWCTSDGRSVCTRMGCEVPSYVNEDLISKFGGISSLIRRERALPPEELPKNCNPSQQFRIDCNECLCDSEGIKYSCTRIDCSALNNNNNGATRTKRDTVQKSNMTCSPGSVFEKGCNVCRCTDEGNSAVCTLRACNVPSTSQENNLEPTVPETDPNFRCNPGEQFKKECNDCTCSADGRSIFCTLRLCDLNIIPNM